MDGTAKMSNTKPTGKSSTYIADPHAKCVVQKALGAPKTSTPKNSGPGRNITGPVSQTTKDE